ncbi:MAG: DNA mismatch repair endonuclease MutL [Eubacteriales bacterium]
MLSFAVANLIAAGEVVDRPASVVKELLENAIDAGADRITVEIQNGGRTLMSVSDNGCGMEPDDLPVAIRRHATSKIKDAADLDGIVTLGFRGEALAAIASVSHMRIISKQKGAAVGAMLEAQSGNIISVGERACSDGTRVIVEELFSNVPARRKFLKKDITEGMAVGAYVEKIALSRPDIAIRFISDGTTRLETVGDGSLKNAVYCVFGREFASKLIQTELEVDGIKVSGFIGRTDNVRANRNYQNFFINGRYVKSKTACAALEQAYTSYIPPEKFPCCVLCIDINPAAVDVNVHPAKLEVKFSNEKPVFEAVYYAVRNALESNVTRPELGFSARVRASSRVSEADTPIRDGREESLRKRQLSAELYTIPRGTTETDAAARLRPTTPESGYSPVAGISGGKGTAVPENPDVIAEDMDIDAERYVREYLKNEASHASGGQAYSGFSSGFREVSGTGNDSPTHKTAPGTQARGTSGFFDDASGGVANSGGSVANAPSFADAGAQAPEMGTDIVQNAAGGADNAENIAQKPEEAGKPQNTVDSVNIAAGADAGANNASSLEYRIVGEVFNSYIIVECGDTMLLIDKHAAHERIIFERLKDGLHRRTTVSQMLMLPVEVMMTSDEVQTLCEYRHEVEAVGFEFTSGKYALNVTAVPEGIAPSAAGDMLTVMAERLRDNTGNVRLTRDIVFEKALYQAACKAAIKAGREYAPENNAWIVDQMMKIPDITFCPHGRPVALRMSHKSLDRQFERC